MANSTIKNGFVKVLTTTRTENDYVGQEAFNRIKAYNRNGVGIVYGNLAISQLNDSEAHEIGRIDGWTTIDSNSLYVNVPAWTDGTKILGISISHDGVISIFARSPVLPLPAGFYRFAVCAPLL